MSKHHRMIGQSPVPRQNKSFTDTSKKLEKQKLTIPVVHYFTRKLDLAPDAPWMIVGPGFPYKVFIHWYKRKLGRIFQKKFSRKAGGCLLHSLFEQFNGLFSFPVSHMCSSLTIINVYNQARNRNFLGQGSFFGIWALQ